MKQPSTTWSPRRTGTLPVSMKKPIPATAITHSVTAVVPNNAPFSQPMALASGEDVSGSNIAGNVSNGR